MSNLRCEPHHRICNLRYGTHGYLCVLPLATWIDRFSQLGYCMLHSLGSIKNRTDLFSGFSCRCQRQQAEALLKTNSSIFYISIHFVGMQLT